MHSSVGVEGKSWMKMLAGGTERIALFNSVATQGKVRQKDMNALLDIVTENKNSIVTSGP